MDSTTLARVRRACWRVWQEDVTTRPLGAWVDLGGLVCHSTGLDHRPWNGAFLTSASGSAQVATAREWFAERNVPWALLVPDDPAPGPVGMQHVRELPVMARLLGDLPPVPDLDLRWGEADTATTVGSAAFGVSLDVGSALVAPKHANPAAALVTAYSDGVPVSTATLVVADDVGGVFGVGTLPEATRRGYGAAVTAAVLHEAVQRGCSLAILNPTAPGYPAYQRLGFVDAPPWQVWADPEVSPPGR